MAAPDRRKPSGLYETSGALLPFASSVPFAVQLGCPVDEFETRIEGERIGQPASVREGHEVQGMGTSLRERHDFSSVVNKNWFREGHRLQPCRHSASLFVLRFSG